MRRTACLLAIAVAIAVPGLAHATGVDPAQATAVQRDQAQTHFVKAKKLYDGAHYTEALEEFRASIEIVASPNTRLYIARCLQQTGHLVAAYVEFDRTAADAKEHEHEDGRYGKAAQAAGAERDAIKPKIGFLHVNVTHPNGSSTLRVAGSPIVRAGWHDPVPVNPGSVDVEVITPGVLPVRKTVTVAAGHDLTVDMDAGAEGVAEAPTEGGGGAAPGAVATDTGGPRTRAFLRPWAYVAGGVGAAGLLTFTIAGAMATSTYNGLKTACGTAPCPASKADEVSSGRTQQGVADFGLVLGFIGIAAGATLFVLSITGPRAPGHASASLAVGPSYAGVRGSF